ncbi:MAG: histidine kinase dimerization/phospho-acceptor domain-containing protein, partial [Bacteroidota bacterium]
MKATQHSNYTLKNKIGVLLDSPFHWNLERSVFPTLFLLLAILLISCNNHVSNEENTPQNQQEVFDFSKYQFNTNKSVALDGNWDFYWNELLSPKEIASGKYAKNSMKVPHNWNVEQENGSAYAVYGCATYHAQVKVPHNAPDLLLSTPFLPTSSAIFINDKLVAEHGKVSKSKDFQVLNMSPIHQLIDDVGTEFTITIQVANYDLHEGGILHNISLGNANYELPKMKRAHFFNLLVVGGTSFLGLFFMLTFFTRYFNNRLFYFGLFIASFGFWKSSITKVYHYYFPDWDWIWSLRVEFISIFLFNFALVGFINSIYPKQNWKPFVLFTQGLEVLLIVLTLLLPIRMMFPIVGYHINWIGIELIYIIFVMIRSIKTNTRGFGFIIWGVVGGLLNFIIFILQDNNIIAAQEAIFFTTNIVLLLALGLLIVDKLFFDFSSLSKKAETALKVKSQFLSVVSHEMRTPMNAVIGMTDLLAKTPLSKTQLEYVESIQVSGNSLITIIDDILDITRIQEGKIRIEHKTFDLYALLKQIHKTFQKSIDEKAIQFELYIHPKVPQFIKSDPARIRQILDNLISNAVKFTKRGSIKITLSAEKLDDQQIKLHFKVKDTGIGIAVESLASIFDQFSQEDSS